ncbi:hypothetical protein PanWU01x14_361090 [Parasponia andersonii]|uniref:Uncharacterized protein n=1 Tax=Parasponia andersonii TaxID=3476 RepID=A0A2P5A7F1_PARAD|nr:hypothetical protein PanWU01x14_361090 [Parasponia andersonii]
MEQSIIKGGRRGEERRVEFGKERKKERAPWGEEKWGPLLKMTEQKSVKTVSANEDGGGVQ